MSYSCEISFKNVDPKDVYSFLVEYKKVVSEHLEDIAKENVWYSPLLRHDFEFDWAKEPYTKMSVELRDKLDNWASKIFHFRYFYLPEHNLLGIFGVPDSVQSIFDNTSYFQNSTDQDYDFEDWKGVPWFEEVANKWKDMPFEDFVTAYTKERGDESSWHHMSNEEYLKSLKEQEYYRKSFCYDEIWNTIGNYLEKDSGVVYLSLYGFYDYFVLQKFNIATYKAGIDELDVKELLCALEENEDSVEFYTKNKNYGLYINSVPYLELNEIS